MSRKNNNWFSGNGNPIPEWFKKYLQKMDEDIKEFKQLNEKEAEIKLSLTRLNGKALKLVRLALAIAKEQGVDIKKIKEKLDLE